MGWNFHTTNSCCLPLANGGNNFSLCTAWVAMIEPSKNTGSWFESHFPWTGEADEFSNKSQQTPAATRQPSRGAGLARPGAFALGFHTGIQFEGGQLPWKEMRNGRCCRSWNNHGFYVLFAYLFWCPSLLQNIQISRGHFQLSHFLSLDVWWFLALFFHLSSVAVAILFIAIPQTCYTRRKTSKTSCINIHAFIKNSRHFKKRRCFCVYIPVLSRELKGLESSARSGSVASTKGGSMFSCSATSRFGANAELDGMQVLLGRPVV